MLGAPQPGGRQPTPGGLALVQAFMNTHYDLAADHGGEVLRDATSLSAWLAAHDLIRAGSPLGRHDLERAVAVREGLRALASSNNHESLDEAAVDSLHRASAGAFTEIRVEPDGPHFTVTESATLDTALGALLAGVARAMLDGTWARLKACAGRDCGWVFYDHSRNQSARWCSMKVCGDREKARAYYQRRTASDP
jgi:predicted RNA-binding Zn ribbon-like protein